MATKTCGREREGLASCFGAPEKPLMKRGRGPRHGWVAGWMDLWMDGWIERWMSVEISSSLAAG